MTNSRHPPASSRAGSSRPDSAAHSILQKRDRPWRAEVAQVLAKKRRLDLHTTYAPKAPWGYTFVPYGTPILSDRCKELSRQQGHPVYIVNAAPGSRSARDPDKISHHVHRIGYHFKADVVEGACEELGYIMHRNQFIKEDDLADKATESRMAGIMAKHGLPIGRVDRQGNRETKDQLRTAIKELFPSIPDVDMEEVIEHAWKVDSDRIGTNQEIPLPERIQLAIGARIRHTYTDYDLLLRAFDWNTAREQCEQACLAKIKEWRGEELQDDAEEQEWIMREYIVIDDDDDVDDAEVKVNAGHEADDEDSAAEQGDTSDSSIEITHYQAREEDLGAESSSETARRLTARIQHPKLHYRPPPGPQRRLGHHATVHSTSHLRNPPPSNLSQPLQQPLVQQNHQQAAMQPAIRDYYRPDTSNSSYGPPQHTANNTGAYRMAQLPTYESENARASRSPYQRIPFDYAYGGPEPRLASNRTDLVHMQAPPQDSRTAPTEMIVDGGTFPRMFGDYTRTDPRLQAPTRPYVYEQLPQPGQAIRVPNYEPYGHPLQSIELNGPETQRGARDPFLPPYPHPRTPPRGMQVFDLTTPDMGYIDLTSPDRRSAHPRQPIHGAPAPVQQVPREGHHSRNASNSYSERMRY